MFNTTFNNISVISCRSVLLVEETTLHTENHQPAASHWQTLSHDVVSSTPHHEWDSNLQHYWSWAQIAQIVVNPTTIWSRSCLPPKRSVKGIVLLLWELKFSIKVHYKADFLNVLSSCFRYYKKWYIIKIDSLLYIIMQSKLWCYLLWTS